MLSSASRRKRYDATGRTDESMFGDGDGEMDWNAYFKELWTGEVNADTLESFRKKYRGVYDVRLPLLKEKKGDD